MLGNQLPGVNLHRLALKFWRNLLPGNAL